MEKVHCKLQERLISPSYPKGLQGNVSVKEGAPTQSVADQEEIKKLFPNTYGMPLIEFVPGEAQSYAPFNVGVIFPVASSRRA